MKVAVTGGTGFIGTRVVRILRERGHEVVCVVRSPEKATALAELGATVVKGDILDRASLDRAFAGAEGVMHIAASYELGVVGRRAREALAQNLDGTRAALEAARDSGAKKIVYTSSIVVYGTRPGEIIPEGWRPPAIELPRTHPTFYAVSKARAHYDVAVPLMEAGAPIVIVQPGGVFGPRDHSVFRVIWACIVFGFPLIMGGARYGVVDVEDCALGHVLALEQGKIGECYHLVDENLEIAELARRALHAAGLERVGPRVHVLPDWLIALNTLFMRVIERVVRVPDWMSADGLRGMAASTQLAVTTDKARRELGWTTTPLEEPLRRLLAVEFRRRGKQPPQLTTR